MEHLIQLIETVQSNDTKKEINSIIEESIERMLIMLIKKGENDTIERILQNKSIQINDELIIEASKKGNIEAVKLLLADKRINPSAKRNDAIVCASMGGHSQIVELLMTDQRVDPSDQSNKAIISAAINDRCSVMELLLRDVRIDPNCDLGNPLRNACMYGHIKIVELLLRDPRVNPNLENNYCSPAIILALSNNRYKIAKLLIRDSRIILDSSRIEKSIKESNDQELIKLFYEKKDKLLYSEIKEKYEKATGVEDIADLMKSKNIMKISISNGLKYTMKK